MGCATTKQSLKVNQQQELQPVKLNPWITSAKFHLSKKVSSQNLRQQHLKCQKNLQLQSYINNDDEAAKSYFSQFLISEIHQEKCNITSPHITPYRLLNKMQQPTDVMLNDLGGEEQTSLRNLNKEWHLIEREVSLFEL